MLPNKSSPPRPQTTTPPNSEEEKHEKNEEAGNHTQLKGPENSGKNKETDLFHLTDDESREDIMKMLRTVRGAVDRDADPYK